MSENLISSTVLDSASLLSEPSLVPRISVSQLKTWGRCRKKFQLDYVNKLRWPTDQSNFQLGQDVHKLLDYHARGLDCTQLLTTATPKVQQAWRLLMDAEITQKPIVASEWGFLVPLLADDGSVMCWLDGRIDRISRDGDQPSDALLVIDWKTGTAVPQSPETDWQTMVYLYATVEARKELGLVDITPEQMRFVYVEVKHQIREVTVAYDSQRHQEVGHFLKKTVQDILAEQDYPLPQACPDRYCPYGQVCGINKE